MVGCTGPYMLTPTPSTVTVAPVTLILVSPCTYKQRDRQLWDSRERRWYGSLRGSRAHAFAMAAWYCYRHHACPGSPSSRPIATSASPGQPSKENTHPTQKDKKDRDTPLARNPRLQLARVDPMAPRPCSSDRLVKFPPPPVDSGVYL